MEYEVVFKPLYSKDVDVLYAWVYNIVSVTPPVSIAHDYDLSIDVGDEEIIVLDLNKEGFVIGVEIVGVRRLFNTFPDFVKVVFDSGSGKLNSARVIAVFGDGEEVIAEYKVQNHG